MSYEIIIPEVNNEKLIYYKQFSSYQGEWLMLTITQDKSLYNNGKLPLSSQSFKLYKDWYGSCSGCDSYEAFMYNDDNLDLEYYEIPIEKKKEFADNYKPFCVIPYDNMINLIKAGAFNCILPVNIDYESDDRGNWDSEENRSEDDIKNKIGEDMREAIMRFVSKEEEKKEKKKGVEIVERGEMPF